MTSPLVSLRAVSKTYTEGDTERVVLRDIDASFGEGEFIVLLGKSGSGKSTLLNIMSGIDVPSAGTIEILGQNLGEMSEEARTRFRRGALGFIFQTYNLIPTLTVEENLRLPLELQGRDGGVTQPGGVSRDGAPPALGHAERARSLLREVGLESRAASFPDVLSGGEQQRVAVARALIHHPALVLADEPTGNLDERTGRDVLDLIDRLTRRSQRTVLVVTHDHDLIERADRVFLLEAGRLTELPRAAPRSPARSTTPSP